MSPFSRQLAFVNAAHFLVHYTVLIFATAVLAIGPESGLGYDRLIPLATGTFLAFGLLSLPVGFLVDRIGARRLMLAFFAATGLACLAVATAETPTGFALALLALGVAAAIYHPVGLSLIASGSPRLGRDLSVNGVCGNLGAALAAAGTAGLTAWLGWQAAFVLPGIAALLLAVAYRLFAWDGAAASTQAGDDAATVEPVGRPALAVAIVALAIVAGGMTYNIVTVALPKIVQEGFSGLSLGGTGALATAIFVCGAAMQLVTGRLVDRHPLPTLFVGLALCQLLGLTLAWLGSGPLLVIGLAVTMAAIYGQVVVDDAIVARFVPARHRGTAYGASYCLGFSVTAVAIPAIGLLHGQGGFAPVLALTAACGALLLVCAVGFRAAVASRPGLARA